MPQLIAWYSNPNGVPAAALHWLNDVLDGSYPDVKQTAAAVKALPLGQRYLTIRVDRILELTPKSQHPNGTFDAGAILSGASRAIPSGKTLELIGHLAGALMGIGVRQVDGFLIDVEQASGEVGFDIVTDFLRRTFAPLASLGPLMDSGLNQGLQSWAVPDLNGWGIGSQETPHGWAMHGCSFRCEQAMARLGIPAQFQDPLWIGMLLDLDQVASQACVSGQIAVPVVFEPGYFVGGISQAMLQCSFEHLLARTMRRSNVLTVFNPPKQPNVPTPIPICAAAFRDMEPAVIPAPELYPVDYSAGVVDSRLLSTTFADFQAMKTAV